MLCKCHWIVLYTVHFTAFCLGGGAFFPGHGVYTVTHKRLAPIYAIRNSNVFKIPLTVVYRKR